MMPIFPSNYPPPQQAAADSFRNQIPTIPSSSSSLPSVSTRPPVAPLNYPAPATPGSSSSVSISSFDSTPPASPTASRGKIQAWSPASTSDSTVSGSIPGNTRNAGLGGVDVSIEGVCVYVSPQAMLARALKRKEHEAFESQAGTSRGDKPPLRERTSFLNLNKILPASNSSSNQPQSTSSPWRRAALRLTEHVYDSRPSSYLLQIQEPNTVTTWLALFRACTRPETYGSQLAPISQGGLYRVWRGVELAIVSGRNIGLPSSSSTSSNGTNGGGATGDSGTGNGGGGGGGVLASEREQARKEVSGNLKAYGRTGYSGGANPVHVLSGENTGATLNGADGVDWAGSMVDIGPGRGKGHGTGSKGKGFGTSSSGSNKARDRDREQDRENKNSFHALEDDIFCEVHVAGELSAYSSIQGDSFSYPSDATPVWNETFVFEDLPAFSDTPQHDRSEHNILRLLVFRVPSRKGGALSFDRFVPGAGKKTNNPSSNSYPGTLEASLTLNPASGSTPGSQTPTPSFIIPVTPSSNIHHHTHAFGPGPVDSHSSLASSNGSSSHVLIGKVDIPLASFRRGDMLDGYWPIVIPSVELQRHDGTSSSRRTTTSGAVLGELRLKIKVDEEVILPFERYNRLHNLLKSQNSVLMATEMEKRIGRVMAPSLLPGVTSSLTRDIMRVCVVENRMIPDILDHMSVEVADSARTNTPLFRGTTMVSLFVQRGMYTYGQAFIKSSIGPVVRRIMEGRVSFETEGPHASDKDLAAGVKECVKWCSDMWTNIYNRREECPQEMRAMLAHARHQVDQHYAEHKERKNIKALRLQVVIAFCFLRLIVPAIMNPYEYNIAYTNPTPPVARSLKQIGKVLQTLANMTNPSSKGQYSEEYQRPILEFIQSNTHAMNDYLLDVSTPKPPAFGSNPLGSQQQSTEEHAVAFGQLAASLSTLHRESIPTTSRPFDLGRSLADICSIIVRNVPKPGTMSPNSASWARPTTSDPQNQEAEAITLQMKAVIAHGFEIKRDVANAVTRLEARREDDIESTSSPAITSSSSRSTVSAQFQSFALSPLPIPIPRSHRLPLAPLAFSSVSTTSLDSQISAPQQEHPSPPMFLEQPRSPSTGLGVPLIPLKPYQGTTLLHDLPSFPTSSVSPTMSIGEITASSGQGRRRSTAKIPSPVDIAPSATRKRSGFFRNITGRRED